MTGQPTSKPICRSCGAEIPPDAPQGYCLKCLFALGTAKPEDSSRKSEVRGPNEADAASPSPGGEGRGEGGQNPPRSVDFPRRSFGDYELLEEIARGGMGIIYRARQKSLGRIVAVKMLLFGDQSGKEQAQRFRAEAALAASLLHPNIVAIHEVSAHEGQPFFVMDFIEGQNLARLSTECEMRNAEWLRRAARYVRIVAEAVHYAHERGILHRDLKPSNVLIDPFDQPRVTDFGLAKRLHHDSELTLSGQVLGSPNYMPPEQAAAKRGLIGRRSDVYSLGAILYHLLTGRPPFMGETLTDTLQDVVNKEPVSPRLLNPNVTRDLETLCLKCLEKEPARRYQTAQGLAEDLDRFLRAEPIQARPVGLAEKVWRWCRRKPVLASLIVALHLAMALGLLGILWQWRRATVSEFLTRQNLYAADMNAAQHAYEDGNLGRAVELLDRHRPNPGQRDLRGFEWRYLWGLCQGDEQATLRGHTDTVTGVAFSPDGRLLASNGKDKTVRIWDVALQPALRILSDKLGAIRSVAFSPDGSQLLAAGDRGVTIWDTHNWTVQRHFAGQFRSTALTRDGQTLVAATKAGVTVLATTQGTGPFPLSDVSGPAVFSSDEERLATLSRGGIKIWNSPSLSSNASPLLVIPLTDFEHSGEHELAFSPDGQIIATGDNDGRVVLFDPVSGRNLATFEHSGRIDTLIFSPDGKTLASASADQTVKLWDVAGRTNLVTLHGHQREVTSVAFSPDGQTLATGSRDRTVKLWEAGPRGSADGWQLGRPYCRISVDAATMANWHGFRLQLLNIHTKQVLANCAVPADAKSWNVSPSSHTVVVITSNWWVQVWNIAANTKSVAFQIPTNLQCLQEFVTDPLLISPNGRAFARDGSDSMVQWWSLPTGLEQRCFPGALVELLDEVVVTMRSDGTLAFWDCRSGRENLVLRGHQGLVRAIVFSPDGQTVATASWDNTARLWDATTGREIGVLRGHKEGLECIDFSPDGRTLATGSADDTIKLWNVATQQEVLTLRPRNSDILILKFVPDGSALISVSRTGMVKMWRAPSWSEIEVAEKQATK